MLLIYYIINYIHSYSLDPITDPLCVLLMIDYHAIQAYEYHFLIDLYTQWEVCPLIY